MPDLPAALFVRPVPEPRWAMPMRQEAYVNGPDLPPQRWYLPAPGPTGQPGWTGCLTGIEAEWVRRNPEAVERRPELRDAMARTEARGRS